MYGTAYRWSRQVHAPATSHPAKDSAVYVNLMVVMNEVTKREIPAVAGYRTPVFTSHTELFVVENSGGSRNFRRILKMNYHGL
jgi:hypothetical protein